MHGSRYRERHRHVASARQLAGVGDQSDECPNGTPGCPGPDSGVDELPCSACFAQGGDS